LDRKAVERLKIFGDETRLKIIKLLASNTVDSLCVNDLANYVGISQQAASQHLKLMKMAGFLYSTRQGNHIYYRLDVKTFRKMKEDFNNLFDMAFKKCEDCDKYPECKDCI
jgi:ArsR family transcriptional regulator